MKGRAATAMIVLSCVAAASRAAAEGTNLEATSTPAAISMTGERLPGLERFDAAMVGFMREHKIPGGSLAVVKNRRLVYARGFGLADVESKEPVLPTSLFRIASVSKMFTGVTILHLIEQGKLRGEDHVFDLLKLEKKVPAGATLDPRWRQVTVYHLLCHEGGWDRNKSPDPFAIPDQVLRFNRAKPSLATDHVLRYMLSRPLDFDPGAGFAYCNFGFMMLGTVIEAVTGRSYEDYVREEILKPIGIIGMRGGKTLLKDRAPGEVRYYQQTEPFALPSNMAANFGEVVPSPYGADVLDGFAPQGGWLASSVDLVRFMTALDPLSEYQILSPAARQQLFRRPRGPSGHAPYGPSGDYYSCGFWIRPKGPGGGFEAWHGGRLWGSSSSVLRRNDGVVAAVLFNARDENPKIDILADAFLAEIHKCSDVGVWPPRGNLFAKFTVMPDHKRGPVSSRPSR
jgi:CubicO group peptidase (beta-lactamase class C family)